MIRKIRLTHLLLFTFITTALAMIGIIVASFCLVSFESEESTRESMRNMLRDTVSALEERITGLEDGSRIAGSFSEIRDFLVGDEAERIRLKDNVRAELSGLVYYEPGAVSAHLLAVDGTAFSACPERSGYQSNIPYLAYLKAVSDYHPEKPFRQQRVTRCYDVSGNPLFAVLTPLYPEQIPPADDHYLGALILIVDFNLMRRFVPDSAQGSILVESSEGILLDNAQVRDAREKSGDRAMSAAVNKTDWSVTVSPVGGRDGSLFRIARLCLIFGAGSVTLLMLMMLFQYRHIAEPIQQLTEQVNHVDAGTRTVSVPERGFAELHTLSGSMDGMLNRLRIMNEERINDRLRYYEDRITFLQAQINPHSLYNNFECIRGMAAQGATDAIREMTTCLAQIYRYCCKGETMVRLEEEANCLTFYRRILELRYGEAYRIETEIAPETRDAMIPRMILQPLAENAVQHGMITPGRAKGVITISSAAKDGRLILTVMDDGAGMDPETLVRYNSGIALHDDGTHSHIGITNVMRRLNMIYRKDEQENAVMPARFENRPEGGLRITMDVPLIT